MGRGAGTGRVTGLDHVQLAMPPGCEADAARFYEGLLGIPQVPKPPVLAARGGCWFEDGAVRVHLGVEDGFRPARKAHPALRVRDLAALVETMRAAGVSVVDGERVDAARRVYVDDPFGNRLELIEATLPVRVRELAEDERAWAGAVLDEGMGRHQARRAEVVDVLDGDGLVAEVDGDRVGLLLYRRDGDECELSLLVALAPGLGVAGRLVDAFLARVADAVRVWVVTTNDNVDALRLYQRHGFRLAVLRPGLVDESRRRLKPGIPTTAGNGIPIRDELELELFPGRR